MGHHTVQPDKRVPALPKHTLLPSSGMRQHRGATRTLGICRLEALRIKAAPHLVPSPSHSCGGMFPRNTTSGPHEHRLRLFEMRVLKGVFRPKRKEATGGWRKLCIKQLGELYCSVHIIWVIKSRMRGGTCGTYWRKYKCSHDFGE